MSTALLPCGPMDRSRCDIRRSSGGVRISQTADSRSHHGGHAYGSHLRGPVNEPFLFQCAGDSGGVWRVQGGLSTGAGGRAFRTFFCLSDSARRSGAWHFRMRKEKWGSRGLWNEGSRDVRLIRTFISLFSFLNTVKCRGHLSVKR